MAKGLISSDELFKKIPKSIDGTVSAPLFSNVNVKLDESNAQRLQEKVVTAINRATVLIAQELEVALKNAMSSSVWSVPSGTGDIIDTGKLMESGIIRADGSNIVIAYTAPYAAIVHYGGYITPFGNQAAKVYLPARPWVQSVLRGGGPVEQFDLKGRYGKVLKELLS
jgi:phage gpG-like protein